MIGAENVVVFAFDEEGQADLETTLETLERLKDCFETSKHCCVVKDEIEILKYAAHIVDEVLRGETF